MSNQTVSIIIPCYNGARFLRATLESALAQAHAPLEVIVIDDGSTDDSATLAGSFGAPVRVIRQLNQGESVARNQGIAEARGDYLMFLDADDLLQPDALEALLRSLGTGSGTVALMGHAPFSDDPTRPYATEMPPADAFFPRIMETNFGPPHCWLTPRAVVRATGGFATDMRYSEDWDFWCRVALTGAPLVAVPYAGALYRRHAASQVATGSVANKAVGHAGVMERLCQGLIQNKALLRQYGDDLFWNGWTALHRCRSLGVPWQDLAGLAHELDRLVKCGPELLRRRGFARLIRLLGVRWAETVRNLWLQRRPGNVATLPA
jgi:glycosyltransferase involved in cell wall biosynthesis